MQRGDGVAALAAAERAVAADETYAEGWAARGTVKLIGGDAAGAEHDLARAATLKPVLAEAHLNRAMALISLNRLDDAERALMGAKTIDPKLPIDACITRLMAARRAAYDANPVPDTGIRLALLLSAAGLTDDAETVVSRCLARAPAHAELWMLKGELAMRRHQFDEAVAAACEAARLQPDGSDAAVNVAVVYSAAGDRARAEAAARQAAQKFPQNCSAWIELADIIDDDFDRGRPSLLAAARAPDATGSAISRALVAAFERVDWDVADALMSLLPDRLKDDSANPFRLFVAALEPALLRRNAEAFSAANWPIRRPLAGPAIAKAKLKVGYLSPDFRSHPVGTTIVDLLRNHDRSRVEVIAYAIGPKVDDPERQAVVAAVDRFDVLSDLADAAAAQRIRDDGIDILIDLAGHTKHSRLGILSFRPAPVQIHYLGCPGTIGAPFIDYIVGDPWTTPVEAEPDFSEAIIRLPHTYLANAHRMATPHDWDRARFGFRADDVILCCFNHPNKITRALFSAWMTVLKAEPRAVLWLRADRPLAETNLREAAVVSGVAPDRIRFAPRVDMDVHLARYSVAELMLDTAPYNAHTTAADALWMGCPVLTVPGRTFAARVCAGLLSTAGLDDLIARDLDDYTRTAIALARDEARRADLRTRLRGTRTRVLFDNAAFARHFETGLSAAWQRAVDGLPPVTIDVRN